MSDVPFTTIDSTTAVQTVVEPSGSIWPYAVGTLIALTLAGIYLYKRINHPRFLIKQIRKRNLQAIEKQGIENNETMLDLDKLLTSVEKYAIEQGMSGSKAMKLLAPLNEQERLKTPKDMYQTMHDVAKSVGDTTLANEFKRRMSGVKANSKLMASLFKRAGI